MIVDSHAHYNNDAYGKPFRYLTRNADGYALGEGDREQYLKLSYHIGIGGSILQGRDPAQVPSPCQEHLPDPAGGH